MNINDIATAANKIKKPTKAEAFASVKCIIINGGQSAEVLADLYAYFLPPIPAKPKTPEQWVAKAMGKKDVRYYLNYIYVNDGVMVATDGHRLHKCPTELPNGYYDSALSPIRDMTDVKYPDYESLVKTERDKQSHLPGDMLVVDNRGLTCYDLFGMHLQKTYVDQVLSGMDNPIIDYKDSKTSVLFTDGDRTALIAPVGK